MNRILTTTVLAAVALVATLSSNAQAESHSLRLQPPGHSQYLPTFGFYYNLNYGWGYYVTGTTYYSAASQFGLEQGDVITGATVNGQYHSLRHGGWQHVVRKAHYSSGHILLHVRDVNSGYTISRWTNTRYW